MQILRLAKYKLFYWLRVFVNVVLTFIFPTSAYGIMKFTTRVKAAITEHPLSKARGILHGYLILIPLATYLTSTSLEMHRPSPKTQPLAPDLECNNEEKYRGHDASLCTKALSWALGCRPLDVEVTHDLWGASATVVLTTEQRPGKEMD